MVFLLKEIPAKHKQPARSVHGRAAWGLLKMPCLLHTFDLSACKLCLSVFRGHIFYVMTSKIVKNPQVRSDLCNDRNIAREAIWVKEVIVNSVTIIFCLV